MRPRSLVKLSGIAALVLLVTGCPNKERNASIEAMNQAVEAASRGANEIAVKYFQEAARLYPENHQAWWGLGQVYAMRQRNWEGAAEAFGQASRYRPEDPMYHMWAGIAIYEDAVEKGAVSTTTLGQALQHIEKAVDINGDLYRAHNHLGLIFRDMDRPKDAAQAWTRAAMLNPSFGDSFKHLGELYLLWDHYDEAERVLQLGTQHVIDERELTNVFYYLGLAYQQQKRFDPAIEAYSRAIELRADNLEARFQRGLTYAAKGDKTRARADLSEYAKAGGGDAFNKQEANKALMMLAME
jgi:tetratricopeptide (TPR) repeat protein